MTDTLSAQLASALGPGPYNPAERRRLIRLMELFAELSPPPDPAGHFPRYAELSLRFREAVAGGSHDVVEESFLELYAHLHMNSAPYTPTERRKLDAVGGYWCHAGGIAPILKAGDWIRHDTVSADFGAGNGLQGLLMQWLYPHQATVQVEISRSMAAIGRDLQRWLGIPEGRVRWVVGDVMDASSVGIDFLYLYRPVRPEGPGRRFYERLGWELERSVRQVVVFSVADCLRDFLSDRFEVFYDDGHLTCLRNRGSSQGPGGATGTRFQVAGR